MEQFRESGVPPKMRQQTPWAGEVVGAWAKGRNKLPRDETEEVSHELIKDFVQMTVAFLQFWLSKFVWKFGARTRRTTLWTPSMSSVQAC